jgi:hypothetical protein
MKQSLSTALTFIICIFLLVEGVWGLFSPVVFGVLTTNRAHALVHLGLGVWGLIAWRTGHLKSYFGFLGSLLFVGSVLWFLPATRALPQDLLNVNGAVAVVNFFLSLLALTIAITETSRRRFGVPGSNTSPPMSVSSKGRKAA